MSDGSNEEWGDYHDGSPAKVKQWDDWERANEFNTNTPYPDRLGNFLTERALLREDLVAFGARWAVLKGKYTLVYAFPDGLKYRTLSDPPKRWSPDGISWQRGKLLDTGALVTEGTIIAEGETDAMQLARAYPTWAVLCLPSGAKHIPVTLFEEINLAKPVLAALDNDEAGDDGAAKILEHVLHAKRMRPPANDWCATVIEHGPLNPDPLSYTEERPEPEKRIYSIRELLEIDFGSYEENNWFADDILPTTGSCVFHAAPKSLKSVVMLDMIRAITTGTQFAGSYPFVRPAGPGKVLYIQMEIRPAGFMDRIGAVLLDLDGEERELFCRNLMTYRIGDRKLPVLNATDKSFNSYVRALVAEADADVVAFDPVQRLTGSADLNSAAEVDALLRLLSDLQNDGKTVLVCAHNNKAGGANAGPHAISGSQRFAADMDSICSLKYDPKIMLPDENPLHKKQRNFSWTLRNGEATGRGIEVGRHANFDHLMYVKFGTYFREPEDPDDPTAPGFN